MTFVGGLAGLLLICISSVAAGQATAAPPHPGKAFSSQGRPRLSVDEQLARAQALLQGGDIKSARALLEGALHDYPENAGLFNLLGVVEAREKRYPAAEAAFRQAVALAPRFDGAYLNLGRLYQEQADPGAREKALKVYERLLQFRPENAEAHYQSAVLFMSQGAFRASLAHLAQLPAESQASAQVLALSCAVRAGLREKAETERAAARLLAHPDFSEADVISIHTVLETNGRDDLSARLLEEIDRRGQASPVARRLLGLVYERLGRLDGARTALEKSATADRPLAPLLVDLARVARQQNDLKGALGYLAHARELEPQNARIHYLFGLVCLEANLLAEAQHAFRRAVDLTPDDPAANYALGLVSAYRNDPLAAVPYLQKYITLRPDDPRGQLALGVAYFNHKDFAAARPALLRALAGRETATAARYHLGSIARQEGRLDEAVRELGEALTANPQYADALAELGHCYLQQKDYRRAEAVLLRAVAASADHYFANFGLLLLYSRTKDPRERAQSARFEKIRALRDERARELLRTIEMRSFAGL